LLLLGCALLGAGCSSGSGSSAQTVAIPPPDPHPCRYLTAPHAAKTLGVPVIRVETHADSCGYQAEHFVASSGSKSGDLRPVVTLALAPLGKNPGGVP
jgi:hypothetical protein